MKCFKMVQSLGGKKLEFRNVGDISLRCHMK